MENSHLSHSFGTEPCSADARRSFGTLPSGDADAHRSFGTTEGSPRFSEPFGTTSSRADPSSRTIFGVNLFELPLVETMISPPGLSFELESALRPQIRNDDGRSLDLKDLVYPTIVSPQINDASMSYIGNTRPLSPPVRVLPLAARTGSRLSPVGTSKRGGLITLPSSRYSMLLPYQMPQVRLVLMEMFPQGLGVEVTRIVDCTAHVGGDAIHFSNTFLNAKIIAMDIDFEATSILTKNVVQSGKAKNFTIITQNCLEWIRLQPKLETVLDYSRAGSDFYYFDPPWGGPTYYTEKDVKLFLSNVEISIIINMVFVKNLTTRVLLKVPRNFAYNQFKENVNGTTKLYNIRKQKKNSIAYNLIDIISRPRLLITNPN